MAAIAIAASSLAGCLGPTTPVAVEDLAGAPAPRIPQAVVALIDTGINPYHADFRDASPLAQRHPSTYLPGYPADAIGVNLTLDAKDLDVAIEADSETWKSLKPHTLYWFPGTKIVAAYALPREGDTVGEPGWIYSTGHGTMTASRAAGNAYSLCPECRIAMVQGFHADAVLWAAAQPWIDAQSNSWSPLLVMQQADAAQSPGLREAFEAAAATHAVFASAGNGVAGKLGVLGHPSFTRSTSGPRGVVSVGGHDNGQIILWSGSWPHVAADACDNWAAKGDSLDEYGPREGGGTSSASPYAAGAAARLVLEARRLLADEYETGVADATFARGPATDALATSPLADGDLSLDELKLVLFRTAVARPVATEHDGEVCGPGPYNTYPVQWSEIPSDAPSYAFIGYGQISVDSVATAIAVLAGATPLPERPVEDEWHARAEGLREAYNDLPAR